MSRLSTYIILLVLAVIILASGFIYLNNQQRTSLPQTQAPRAIIQSTPIPTLTTTSRETPVQIKNTRGIITSVTKLNLTVQSPTGSVSFDISKTSDFQKIVSGTLETGSGKTVPVSLSDLKVGQEVLVVTDLSNKVLSVFIIK